MGAVSARGVGGKGSRGDVVTTTGLGRLVSVGSMRAHSSAATTDVQMGEICPVKEDKMHPSRE